MGTLDEVGAVWERAAVDDPYFAVLSDPERRGGRWDADEFFSTGRAEVEAVLGYLAELGVEVDRTGTALDFGSGLGRLTQALGRLFAEATGVDISATMVAKAQGLSAAADNVTFVRNQHPDLRGFEDGRFALVYSNIVLQHLPRDLARVYVQEFIRVVRPGGVVVFQIPGPQRLGVVGRLRKAVQLRTRIAALLGRAPTGRSVEWEMHGTSERTVRSWVEAAGQKVLDVVTTNATDPAFNGNLTYHAEAPPGGWVSRQYTVVKR